MTESITQTAQKGIGSLLFKGQVGGKKEKKSKNQKPLTLQNQRFVQ